METRKLKRLFKNMRIIILLIALVFAVVAIHPNFGAKGVAIRSVMHNSSAQIAGIRSPKPTDQPVYREVIYDINGHAINNVDDYSQAISGLVPNQTLIIKTRSNYYYEGDKRRFSFFKKEHLYRLVVKPKYNITVLNETYNITVPKIISENITANGTNKTVNRTINITKTVHKIKKTVVGAEDIGLRVYNAPTTNIRKGLDLQGGTRALLQPETANASDSDLDIIIANLKKRLNVYGLSDIVVRKVTDMSGNRFILVEIAGATEEEVKELISKQGKFEAKIGNKTVFKGGQDIKYVCRSPECSYAVNPRKPCQLGQDGNYHCSFVFSITLSPEAAQRQADATKNLKVIEENGFKHLSKKIDFYLDDQLVDSLNIAADLKGKAVQDISITGPGSGKTMQEAMQNSAKNMKNLQTILITGSLPVKLDIVKIDSVSPFLGEEFINNAIFVGLLAIFAVIAVIYIRYRNFAVTFPVAITMISEVVLLLGLAALTGWNLDLAAIAGIIIAVGTGVDDQVVIADEFSKKDKDIVLNWKEKIKRAFFIIMASYATTVVAMIPLWTAGAGLLKGFALTTIFGVSFGVFITRPAFAAIVETFMKE